MPNRPRTLRFILDNLGWLLASLVLAVVVWYVAVSGLNPVEQRRFQNRMVIKVLTDPGLLVVSQDITTAQVSVRAPQSVWENLDVEDVNLEADLTRHDPGIYTIRLRATLLKGKPGQVVDIQPSQVTVELAQRAEKLLNITVVTVGEPSVGFRVISDNTTATDPTARVVGSDTKVNQVKAVQARVSVRERSSPFNEEVSLIAVDAEGNVVAGVDIVPTKTTINVDIEPRPDVTVLVVIPRLIGTLPAGYINPDYSLSQNSVGVRGDRTTIDRMGGKVYTEPIDFSGKTQTFTERVKLALPDGVVVADPVDITVTVEITPVSGSKQFDNIPVKPQGLDPADYTITVQPDRVSVILTGPQPILDTLTADDINVIAPLSGLGGGKFTVTLKASVTKSEISARLPNDKAEVTIIALNPTVTPTPGPTRTATPTPTPTGTTVPTS